MNIVIVPSLKSELLSSTALTPTQHKGGLGGIIGIVAAIAIPFAAPAIAASIGLSSAIGATLASGLVGAALGAATAAITGGNIAMGAIGGGIGGGIAGYNAAPVGLNGGSAAAAGGAPGQLTAPGALAPTGVTTAPLAPIPGSTVAAGPATAAGSNFTNVVGQSFVPTAPVTYNSAGQALTGGTGSPISLSPTGGNAYTAPQAGLSTGVAPVQTVGAGGTSLGSGLPGAQTSVGFNANPSAIVAQAPATPTANEGFSFKGLADKVFSSETAQQGAGQLLSQALSGAVTGDTPDVSSFEQAKIDQLNAARAQEQELLDKKQAVSDSYVQQASNINPYYYGQQALTEEQNRLNRAQQTGLRRIAPSNSGQRDAQVRRNALDKSRLSGFDRGRQEAEAKRLQYLGAAQASAPTGRGISAGLAADLAAEDARYKRLEGAGQEARDIFDPIINDIFGTTKKKKLKEGAIS
jgi:hypothetical protein